MPKITFLPDNVTIEYEIGGLPYRGEGWAESLLDVALNHGLALRHACGGICACTTCHVIVKAGDEHLSPMEKDEEDRIYRITDYTLHSRLACRAVVGGDVVVFMPDSGREAEAPVPTPIS
ncbi:MAG: 2Fe-2S iron-sulfur cluster binding domain-containing protein [Acidobacteria bacterium]|nr:2Fe-2S iron-sulfur cluster binding domain-containing protein [Acidobacteriota bacterium]